MIEGPLHAEWECCLQTKWEGSIRLLAPAKCIKAKSGGLQRGRIRGLHKYTSVQKCIHNGSRSDTQHQPLAHRHSPDAFDELRDTVHSVAIMRHDAARAAMHMRQVAISTGEEQQPALASAVVGQWHLR